MQVEDLREENMELREQLGDLRREMDEMYDTFRENELDEFRELQRELDLTAKNCRVLQFKLRKAERRADQVSDVRNTIQYRIIQYNTIQEITGQYNTGQCNTIQYNTRQCNTIQYRTVQYNTGQYNTIQDNTIQYRAVA